MKRHAIWLSVVGAALLGGCPPAPAKAYTPAEVEGLTSLTEAMRVLAERADPWFGRRGDTSFSAEEFVAMAGDAEFVAAAGRAAGAQLAAGHPDGFRDYAKGLEAEAAKWQAAAQAKDAAAATAALTAIKERCAGCHSDYR
jgi:cytochrome c556